jgi:serine/threonine protein kinase
LLFFKALRKLHKLNIIHRDLKPQNILVKNKDNPNKIELFIADFDWSKQFTKKSIENTAHFATK